MSKQQAKTKKQIQKPQPQLKQQAQVSLSLVPQSSNQIKTETKIQEQKQIQNIIQKEPISPEKVQKLQSLKSNIDILTKNLQRRQIKRKDKKIKQRQELNDLYDAIQQKSSITVSKIQDLARKPTIVINIQKILPQIPEQFPKNYYIQIVYEDVTLQGNQKFTDFDQNIIQQKFILPLLHTQTAKIQIWLAEQQPSLYDRALIHLQNDIAAALQNTQNINEIPLQNNPELSIGYKVQLQGIGFGAWLKNVKSIKEADQERQRARKLAEMKGRQNRQKVEEKRREFRGKFSGNQKGKQVENGKTKQYDLKGIQEILDSLGD